MARIFGFDIGTTSIGFAVIDHDDEAAGRILWMGTRIFPEARDPKGHEPKNQTRRQKRMMRRQLRRRRQRRRDLNQLLTRHDLLPGFGTPEWQCIMAVDAWEARRRSLEEALTPHEVGRALYHLAQRRHFRGRDIVEEDTPGDGDADEVAAKSDRERLQADLKRSGKTLGAYLAERGPHQRKRGTHAHRGDVEAEFEALWAAQAQHHPVLRDPGLKAAVHQTIFFQRPVFWRRNTLIPCRLMPTETPCPKGSWLSLQKRMLEKLNNLAFAGGNARPLDAEERAAILTKLQVQGSMTWGGVREALKPLMKARGEAGLQKSLRFNLEVGGDKTLPGNPLEAKLADIFGAAWPNHPHKNAIRDAIQDRLWHADYGEIGDQRIVILREDERRQRRAATVRGLMADFELSEEEGQRLADLQLPAGWDAYSATALRACLPHLEAGVRFGALINGPDWEDWRNATFPARDLQATGEELTKLPSPKDKSERERLAQVRNPTVVRVQNELRKVVNNLIEAFGKPDKIRIELAREVGKSKAEREEIQNRNRSNERDRKKAKEALEKAGIANPKTGDIEKWLLWQEGQCRCPYSGDAVSFDDLFGPHPLYDVEHIRPRSISFDNSFANKTICRRDLNAEKGNRTPWQWLGADPQRWQAFRAQVAKLAAPKPGAAGLPRSKVNRLLAKDLPEDFTARQLVDTGYAARQILAQLKRLWPDLGPTASVRVEPVTGRVTAQLRRFWGLNNVLAEDGEKTRADHRHHAVDALVVACTHPGMTNRLSRYWQRRDEPGVEEPDLPPPWPTIRRDAERAVADIVVSHRVRKKVSGGLHKETVYGDTGIDTTTNSGTYREFVTRKPVASLSKGELETIRDPAIRRIVQDWVAARGGDPKKAFPPFPTVGANGPEIRKVRLLVRQQIGLMAPVATGYADLGGNHHVAIFRLPDGKVVGEVVSLFEAARRLARRQPVVRRQRGDGAVFLMSLAPGDTIRFPDGERAGLWVVTGVWASGQVILEAVTDAAHATTYRPMASSIQAANVQKVSVDPIGRVRRAGD